MVCVRGGGAGAGASCCVDLPRSKHAPVSTASCLQTASRAASRSPRSTPQHRRSAASQRCHRNALGTLSPCCRPSGRRCPKRAPPSSRRRELWWRGSTHHDPGGLVGSPHSRVMNNEGGAGGGARACSSGAGRGPAVKRRGVHARGGVARRAVAARGVWSAQRSPRVGGAAWLLRGHGMLYIYCATEGTTSSACRVAQAAGGGRGRPTLTRAGAERRRWGVRAPIHAIAVLL